MWLDLRAVVFIYIYIYIYMQRKLYLNKMVRHPGGHHCNDCPLQRSDTIFTGNEASKELQRLHYMTRYRDSITRNDYRATCPNDSLNGNDMWWNTLYLNAEFIWTVKQRKTKVEGYNLWIRSHSFMQFFFITSLHLSLNYRHTHQRFHFNFVWYQKSSSHNFVILG